MSGSVSISLMGPFALRLGVARQRLHLAGNTKRLFMLLAGHFNRGLRRERIVDEIWPEVPPDRAASALNTGLWRIKQCLAAHDGLTLTCIDDVVRLDVRAPAAVDAEALERATTAVRAWPSGEPLDPALRRPLAETVAHCRGDFLEGCDDHWVLPLRERYATLYIQALIALMRDAAALAEFDGALCYGRRILEIDPFREATQREVMRLYMANGQRARAVTQYLTLKAQLEAELGIEPMSETTALFVEIAHPARPVAGDAGSAGMAQGSSQ
jgi:DNA-binding SARP family transcriptional activator